LCASNPDALYQRLVSHWTNPEAIVIGGREPRTILSNNSHINDRDLFTEHMMLLDTVSYLPDDILVKVDRAGMSASLETRAPLLDHRVFEFAARVPLKHKLKGSQGKLILRRVLGRYLPETMFDRPKTGFGVPIDAWLRGPLRDWAEDLLSEKRLSSQGFFRPAPIRQLWQAHLEQRQSTHYLLWDILMFQAWLDQGRDSSTQSEAIAASYGSPCLGT
jgi:asparagine synthase (glutamine-hydrolysing)